MAAQRYRTGAYGAMVADDNGPWVRWSDVEAVPSGWPQRIAAMEPWINRYGPHDVVCHFCRATRSVNSPTSQQHEPDCLWQNAKEPPQ